MPKKSRSGAVDFNFVIATYIIGLYGGLVSGIIVSLATQSPSSDILWDVGIILVAIGLVIFVIINKLLRKKK